MSEERYNGWTNYETWVVKLWLDNDEGSYEFQKELAREVLRNPEHIELLNRKRDPACQLGNTLKDALTEQMPEVVGMWSDLLNASWSEVNWYEIAGSILEEMTE